MQSTSFSGQDGRSLAAVTTQCLRAMKLCNYRVEILNLRVQTVVIIKYQHLISPSYWRQQFNVSTNKTKHLLVTTWIVAVRVKGKHNLQNTALF